ncbi:hypothetical protein M0R72_06060 [Candidatus Pacearchaeota archaeon]|jgi:hypothetical protein|nr:hypothetical protein [Candidatus Pacearchaeota archaeon]
MTDASMDLWAAKSALPSWWNAALLPTTATPIVTGAQYGQQGVLMANWNTIEGMQLPFYVTQGIPGNIAATGISEYGDVGVDYRNVYYDANGQPYLAATAPAGQVGATEVTPGANVAKYIIYATIIVVALIILYKVFLKKKSTPSIQYVQVAPTSGGGGDE